MDSDISLFELGKLWIEGAKVDWQEFHRDENRLRIPLPTYSFDRKKYWVDQYSVKEASSKNCGKTSISSDLNDWLYLLSWKRAISLKYDDKELDKDGCWLVFAGQNGLGASFTRYLINAGIFVVNVDIAEGYFKTGEASYTINPENKEDYKAVIRDIFNSGKKLKTIVHFWNVTEERMVESRLEFSEKCQKQGFYSLLYLAQALEQQGVDDKIRIAAISNNMHSISNEDILYSEKATILGPCKVIPREYCKISCQSIDLVLPRSNDSENVSLIESVLAEIIAKTPNFIVALRGKYRWLQTFENIKLDVTKETVLVREGSTYLITGGLGGLGLAIADYMVSKAKVKLVLTRRTPFPDRSEWMEWLSSHKKTDKTSIKINQIIALEKMGSEIMIVNADISDLTMMRRVVSDIKDRFDKVDGVIHAAGIADNGLIGEKRTETAARVLEPKVKGTLVLDEIFKNDKLDYFVLFSSSSAVLGNAGFVDYCAANTFMDHYAYFKNSTSETYTVAINWDEWNEVGMAADNKTRDRVKNKIPVNEGLILLDRIVSSRASPQVIVSSGDFTGMIENIQNYLLAAIEGGTVLIQDGEQANNRPDLQNSYESPRNEVEEAIVDIWQNLLGIHPIGIHDDFFDLGGHSLLATTLASELGKKFQKGVSLQRLFENATVAQLSEMFKTESEVENESEDDFEEGEL